MCKCEIAEQLGGRVAAPSLECLGAPQTVGLIGMKRLAERARQSLAVVEATVEDDRLAVVGMSPGLDIAQILRSEYALAKDDTDPVAPPNPRLRYARGSEGIAERGKTFPRNRTPIKPDDPGESAQGNRTLADFISSGR